MTEALPLIRTELYRSRITGDLVPRQRLLTLFVTPAGYGKTTLVSNWLDTCGCPSAWLSLDEGAHGNELC
jgi:LuxR family maltose regulon positive regulatory protein